MDFHKGHNFVRYYCFGIYSRNRDIFYELKDQAGGFLRWLKGHPFFCPKIPTWCTCGWGNLQLKHLTANGRFFSPHCGQLSFCCSSFFSCFLPIYTKKAMVADYMITIIIPAQMIKMKPNNTRLSPTQLLFV